MNDADQEPLPKYFGDYPHGAYWSADVSAASSPAKEALTRDERRQRMGKRIRLMPDTGVFPLWGATGGLSPSGARDVLGLDDDIVNDLVQWGQEADYLVLPADWRERGVVLHQRLQDALGSDYQVDFMPD